MSFRSRRGANAIEFALTLPAFVLAMFAVIQLGVFFFAWTMADEGARRACAEAAMLDEGSADPVATATAGMATFVGHGGLSCGQLSCAAELSGAPPERVLTCRATADMSQVLGLEVLPLALSVEHQRVLAFQ